MTRVGAATRGSIAGMAWAAVFLATGAAILRAAPAVRSVPGMGSLLAYFAPTPGDPGKWLTYCCAAALAGGIAGLVGRRLRAEPARRVAALWVTFYPAGGFALALVTWVASTLSRWRFVGPSEFAIAPVALPLIGLSFAALALVFLPLLAIPLLATAATVEAWTRPDEAAQSPLATPLARAGMVALLVVIAGMALVYLWLSWTPAPGRTWLVP